MPVIHADMHSNTTNTRRLSGGVWGRFPFADVSSDKTAAYFKMEDFLGAAPEDALSSGGNIIGDAGLWTAVTTASGTEMAISSAIEGGAIVVSGHTDDNDENYLGFGAASGGPIDVTVGGQPFWFEACLKHSALTNSFFIGLLKGADVAAATLTDDTGVVKDTDYIGFGANYTDGKTTLYCRTKKTSTTAVTPSSNCGTITADTYYRVGLYYDGTVLRFYVNGLEVASRTLTTTDITAGVQLTPAFAEINDAAGAAVTHTIDWIAFGQKRG